MDKLTITTALIILLTIQQANADLVDTFIQWGLTHQNSSNLGYDMIQDCKNPVLLYKYFWYNDTKILCEAMIKGHAKQPCGIGISKDCTEEQFEQYLKQLGEGLLEPIK